MKEAEGLADTTVIRSYCWGMEKKYTADVLEASWTEKEAPSSEETTVSTGDFF